jgi:diacylglycerol kinase (ATP)
VTTRTLLVTNETAGAHDAGGLGDVIEILQGVGPVEPWTAGSVESFDRELRDAAPRFDRIVVAGGDGTLNLTVNALRDRLEDFVLGAVPSGTGNDLARSLGLGTDAIAAARRLVEAEPGSLDVGIASGPTVERLFLNACMGGFPVEVDEAIDERLKSVAGPLAFWVGGARAALDLETWIVELDGAAVPDTVAVGVGNGRTAGGGIEVWPEADLSDGLLDTCVIPMDGVAAGIRLLTKVKKGAHLEESGVRYTRKPSVRIDADRTLEFNVDGEVVGLTTPATFELYGRVRMLRP